MPRELLLLRHGKSDWNTATDDFHRPLKDRGKRGAQRIGVWLAQQECMPDTVIASPAHRALVTAEKCCKAMGGRAAMVQPDPRIYLADTRTLLEVLADCQEQAHRVMLVGHNPGLEQLLTHLAAALPPLADDGKRMPTATLARLAMPDDWRRLRAGQAQLLQLVRASSLPKRFPYPAPDGAQRRPRPAYYYTQSSVIPYRIKNGSVEILIIRSSQKKHWVVPKGIAEPGYSLQESASIEAWEEAGIEGAVAEQAIGQYEYAKWGASCSVHVFAMQVERELNESDWQENHRGRQWVSVAQAIDRLKQAELGPMLKMLEKQLAG